MDRQCLDCSEGNLKVLPEFTTSNDEAFAQIVRTITHDFNGNTIEFYSRHLNTEEKGTELVENFPTAY